MVAITISREYGSGGSEIAARVGEKLGFRFFDKRLIAHLASDIGLQLGEVVDFSADEYEARNFLERLLERDFGPRTCAKVSIWKEDASGAQVEEVREMDEPECISFMRSAIEGAYQRGDVVIVGRGGQKLLADQPDALHVRVEAPLNERIERVQAREGVKRQVARQRIKESDRASEDYVRRFYDADWSDSILYHLTINTGRLSVEEAACLVVRAVDCLEMVDPSG